MGPPTDPGPSGSARVSKSSVCPCFVHYMVHFQFHICLSHSEYSAQRKCSPLFEATSC
ncbi:unnamed protein product, partial [Staurois parvus]